jgi:serine/threonine-protein kinase
MVSNELGACEWFVWDLRRSGLIDRGQLDQIVGEFLRRNPRAEAPALAEHLVNQRTLTAFQAERILNGKTQGLALGPYVLQDAIGQGSMGQVYRATSKNDNILYAVKVLPRRSMWNVRLARRQVRAFGQFSHPSVVPFVDVGTAGGLHYLAWPLVEGQTLEAMVQQDGRLSPEQTALVGVQVARGLAICHANNIFHGLIKPSNIMIDANHQVRILDFGIGCLLAENEGESLVDTMSTANTLTSGLDCASPESIMEPTNRTPAGDQYSLGCVLYYCLTGRVPFPEGSAVEKMMAHQTQEPVAIQEFVPECPEGLVAVVAKLMAKAPEDRFSGTDDVVEALEPYLGELAPVAAAAAVAPGYQSGHAMVGIGSKPRMAGLASSNGNGRPPAAPVGLEPFTPPPAGRLEEPARPSQPPLPSRAAFQPKQVAEVPLTPATDPLAALNLQEPAGYSDAAALRASAGWVTEAVEQSEKKAAVSGEPTGNGVGTVGLVALATLLMAVAFFAAQWLLK